MERPAMFELGKNQKTWIKALRSKEFKQGKIILYNKSDNTFCCLGVANQVCTLGENSPWGLLDTYDKMGLYSGFGKPNDKIARTLYPETKFQVLSRLNDYEDFPFEMIADILEKYPEVYFRKSA